ncbi:MAG: hypothetical protein HYX53_03020 [Chloroflexi bacterium]|jgi:hypothetical protein|nr:hypothetical protein [Chloroflexota bacterium]
MITRACRSLAILVALGGAAVPAAAEMSLRELVKESQNPLPALVSVPVQNNFNIGYGPEKGLQDGLNIQPIIPVPVTPGLNIITRTVVPLIFNPALSRDIGAISGLGDVQITPFFSPSQPSPWVWGIGPVIQLPTHSNPTLGNNNLGLGPSVAALRWTKDDPFLFGALAYTAWSVNTDPRARAYSIGSLQPLATYIFDDGLYVTTSPLIKFDWLAAHDRQVLLPLGGGIGKIFHAGKVPVSTEVHAYYNVMKRDFDADWQVRFQVQVLFPR